MKLCIAVLCAALPAAALQQGQPRFGDKGEIVAGGGISIHRVTYASSGFGSTTLDLLPSASYFVVQNVEVGLLVRLTRTWGDSQAVGRTEYAIEPSLGFNVPLADNLSLLPRLGVEFVHSSASFSNGNFFLDSAYGRLKLGVFVPLLVHPVPHFFLGLGPKISTDLATSGDWGPPGSAADDLRLAERARRVVLNASPRPARLGRSLRVRRRRECRTA